MKEQTFKERIELNVLNLMDAALELADIASQPIDKHGMITVGYEFISEIIQRAQRAVRIVGDELSWIASGDADLSEIYPEMKGGEP